jgi:hypothetical protein
MNPGRDRGHFPVRYEGLEPGKETSVHKYQGHEAAPADLPLTERPELCAVTLAGVRA